MKWIISILFVFFYYCHASLTDVIALTNETFDEAIRNNPFILVEFFAPWCKYCKQFAPEYKRLARIIKEHKKPYVLAVINGDLFTEISDKEGITGFPTFKLYVNGISFKYRGEVNYKSLLEYLDKKTSPPSTELRTEEDVNKQKEATNLRCIYSVSKNTLKSYMEAALISEDYSFYHAHHKIVKQVFPEAKEDSVILLKDFDEKIAIYDEELTVDKFKEFLNKHNVPRLTEITQRVIELTFTPPGRQAIYLFYDPTDNVSESSQEAVKAVAEELKTEDYLFVLADITEELGNRVAEYLGIVNETFPLLEGLIMKKELIRYRHVGSITREEVRGFIDGWKSGKVKRYFKSEEEPKNNPGPVYTVVGSTFKKIVLENDDDVVVKFYTPWCKYCKNLIPIYKKLAESLSGNKKLKFTELDATKNDIEGHVIQAYPVIKLFKGKNKTSVVEYEGNFTAIDIATFIRSRASYSFKIPESVYKIKETIEIDKKENKPKSDL